MTVNPFPPHRVGIARVRAVPYLQKERWPSAPFGDRWRAIKARQRANTTTPEQPDEPAWPPAPIEGEPIPLPGLDDVPERPADADRRPSWTA